MGHISKSCPTTNKQKIDGSFSCHRCGKTGHKALDCPEKLEMPCYNCNEKGHLSKNCPKEKIENTN